MATGNRFSRDADRFRPMRRRLGSFVEELLDDVAIEGVPLFHTDVQQLEGVLEAGQAAGELLLRGPARALVGGRPRAGQRLDRRAGAIQPALDLVELRLGRTHLPEGGFDAGEARGS